MECIGCGKNSLTISGTIGVCRECIEADFEHLRNRMDAVHFRVRREFGMPVVSPRAAGGVPCDVCVRGCMPAAGQSGYCAVRANTGGDVSVSINEPGAAYVQCWSDFLPATCAAPGVCPGCSDAGYPDFSHEKGPEKGYSRLTVHYNSCNFNCLFCQHWEFRERATTDYQMTPVQVASLIDESTACVCFTGGDAVPQIEHALHTAELALRQRRGRILRVCFETNGSLRHGYLQRAARLAYESGGLIKIDIKAYSPRVHYALCGVSNRQVLNNFRSLQRAAARRPDPPLLAASTVLIPGYITPKDVWNIADFIARNDKNTPYLLLGFFPHFYFHDMPATSRDHARQCLQAAKEAGLKNVSLANSYFITEKEYLVL